MNKSRHGYLVSVTFPNAAQVYSSYVHLQVALTIGFVRTVGTLKWLFPSVNGQVLLQVAFSVISVESLPT